MNNVRDEWLAAVERHRHNPTEPGSDTYWSPTLETASRDEIHAIQTDKLRVSVAYMATHSPMYARLLQETGISPQGIRSVADLSLLPVVTKDRMSESVAEAPPWGEFTAVNEGRWLSDGWQVFQTSGTTAASRAFRYTQRDREWWAWANARSMYAMGIRRGRDVAMLLFGYGPHVAMWGMHHGLLRMGVPQLAAGGLDTRTRIATIERMKPTVLACTPSYALHLGAVMQEMGLNPADTAARIIISLGEAIPESSAKRIREMWGVEIHQFYGCTEVAPSCGGYTCEAGSLHFLEDTHLIETVDPVTRQPVPEGEAGIAVITNLMSESSPQIRFEVGDYTTLSYEGCSCGRTHVVCKGAFAGRADDMLNIRGVTLFPSTIENVVRGIPEAGEEFKIILDTKRDLDEVTLVVEQRDKSLSEEDLRVKVHDRFRTQLELRPVVEVLPYGSLPETVFKAKRVEDRR